MRIEFHESRWSAIIATSLVAFASLVMAWQFRHYDGGENGPSASLVQIFLRGEQLAGISNIVDRSQEENAASGTGWYYDLALPKNARVFMSDMIGPTNYNKIGYYFYFTYHLFPREIGTSLDHVTRATKDGFLGKTSESNEEIYSNGFDVIFDVLSGNQLLSKTPANLPLNVPTSPAWFNSNFDTVIAFLLPWLTALSGLWLLRFLFPTLSERIPLPEQLACSLGLGMMAVAALTLGVKLCGLSGRGLILSLITLGSLTELWRDRKVLLTKIAASSWKIVLSPIAAIIGIIGFLVFLILFRIAGLHGFVDPDAMRWMVKAKILHLCTGSEIVKWFSNPALAHAHLDYPTLVPSLHSATYDSIGHVDEFVTKFWPAWMLLFLLLALASLNRAGNHWRQVSSFVLLGLLLLPAIQLYVQWEGSTLPMVFFTVLGFVECALWLAGKDRARLGLGLTLLYGAAMAKFEGFIILALVGSWMLLLPSARPSLKPSPGFWRMLAFWFLATLPFLCLRVQIPALHFESGWAGYALHHPGSTLANCPWIFMVLVARLFVSSDFANWSGEGGQLHWIGRWDGFSSLYNHLTLGLAWLCLLLTVALWLAVPARRPIIVWMLAMLVGALTAFSLVFAALSNVTNLISTIGYTADYTAGRYLLPMLLSWFATLMILFFAEPALSTSISSSPGAKSFLTPQSQSGLAPVGRHRKNKAGKQRHLN
jgi:hypothetical protein